MRPEVSDVAEGFYSRLGPAITADDESTDWTLLKFVDAIVTVLLGDVDTIVSDTDEHQGWEAVFNVEDAPEFALDYLAQFVGVKIEQQMTAAQKRLAISTPAGFARGTIAAMRAAAQAWLTGDKTVNFTERDGGAYLLTVETYIGETPNADAVEAALIKAKPAGILLTYAAVVGLTYADLESSHADYAAVEAAYSTYDELRRDTP